MYHSRMVDTVLEYALEEKWDNSKDQHLVVRETPAAKVRENIARMRRELLRAQLEGELAAIHHVVNYDDEVAQTALPQPKTKGPWRKKWDAFWDGIAVSFCRYVHRFPDTIKPTDLYITCMACQRKYALPWAEAHKLPADVYVYSGFVAPKERTVQAPLRSKAHARIIE